MVDQGRLAKVILALLAAMVGGALVLLVLEGEPIQPMAFSLSSQTEITTTVADALVTERGIDTQRWNNIQIYYRSNNGQLSDRFGLTGELALSFHFVISDGSAGRDGEVFASRQWLRQVPCVPLDRAEDHHIIKIGIIGNVANPVRTPAQARNLERLVASLVRHCRITTPVRWVD